MFLPVYYDSQCCVGLSPKILMKYIETSQSFSTAYSIVGHGEAGAYLQQSTGRRWGPPWTARQSIAGQHTNNHAHTHTPKGNLDLTDMSLDCGRKPEYPVRTHACMMENMQTPCRKTPSQGSNTGSSCCKATNCAIVQAALKLFFFNMKRCLENICNVLERARSQRPPLYFSHL
ncbi:hypothetical protein ATANTOWER_001359 [Ataeniobius toweri]|uniref:Uncharacterized protein n=1 Tax=Ataeniobius toweri TaxID=208326 RepID=A0ABU7BAY0_9TELE|nr:hypothetical protein [Ataeniobius toweri]